LRELCAEARTVVLFESPRRMLRLLDELSAACGDRRVAIAREMTKRFEEILRGTVSEVREELAGRASLKGEFVVVLEGAGLAAKRRRA
jgi:16S rRNA (cytidine1402-2'-O)-methyltransferase